MVRRILMILALTGTLVSPALAHPGVGHAQSFMSGIAHPLGGMDHILAMAAVGVWGVLAQGRAIWLWPAVFVASMLAGFLAAILGLEIPFVESAISSSIIALGLCIALAIRPPLWAGATICAAFAVFHGYAHATGTTTANALPYVAGFALATAWIHSVGIGLGLVVDGLIGKIALRFTGGLTVLTGIALVAAQ